MGNLKQVRRTLRRPFETGGVLLLKMLIPLLPRGAVVALSRMAGRLAILLPLREKHIGRKNIDAVFGDSKSPREKNQILTTSFATFSLTMLDVFWFSRNPEKRIHNYVDIEDSPHMTSFFEVKPIICITAHMGSWEIMGQACALMGIDLASIAATV